MSQLPNSPTPADDLQFNAVEPIRGQSASAPASAMVCVACKRPMLDTYFAVGNQVICASCREQVLAKFQTTTPLQFVKAALFGLGGGLLGALAWLIVRRLIGWEIGLIAILVGYLVARGIRKGSGGRGGTHYQILALVLTYVCICSNYAVDIVQAIHRTGQEVPLPEAIYLTARYSLSAPFLGGANNILGIVIIGFALYEAWKLTAHRLPPITGPYQVGRTIPVAGVQA